MKTTLYCLLICYLSIWASCNKNFDCRGTVHNFEAFYKAYPDTDSIRVNDTIWIELQTSTQLKDIMTNQMVDYSGAANLGTIIGYSEMTGGDLYNPGGTAAANSFENILINGSSVQSLNPDQIREFLFEENNGMYLFKVGIVPKKTGLFLIGAGNSQNVYQKNNSCRKSNFELTFKDTNQHLYLYEQNRPGYTPSEYEQTHAYCFKVY
jgi:hypothetical protein